MRLYILGTCLFLTAVMNAQQDDSWRLSANIFLAGGFVDNTEGGYKPKQSEFAINPKFSYGLNSEVLFKVSRKMKLSAGLGLDFRNFKTQIDRFFTREDNGKPIFLIGDVQNNNQLSLFVPLSAIHTLNKHTNIVLSLNPNFRLTKNAAVYTTELDNSNRQSFAPNSATQIQTFNVKLQCAFEYKADYDDTKMYFIRLYFGYFILKDNLWLNYGNNHFWEGGITVGLEFQSGEEVEKKKKKSSKRRKRNKAQ
jgi:hypothetical protein